MSKIPYDPTDDHEFLRTKVLQAIERLEAKGMKEKAYVCRKLLGIADLIEDSETEIILRMAVQFIADDERQVKNR